MCWFTDQHNFICQKCPLKQYLDKCRGELRQPFRTLSSHYAVILQLHFPQNLFHPSQLHTWRMACHMSPTCRDMFCTEISQLSLHFCLKKKKKIPPQCCYLHGTHAQLSLLSFLLLHVVCKQAIFGGLHRSDVTWLVVMAHWTSVGHLCAKPEHCSYSLA